MPAARGPPLLTRIRTDGVPVLVCLVTTLRKVWLVDGAGDLTVACLSLCLLLPKYNALAEIGLVVVGQEGNPCGLVLVCTCMHLTGRWSLILCLSVMQSF